jgi:cyclophilin family peptidyl-prolyl cis-trans isomerase
VIAAALAVSACAGGTSGTNPPGSSGACPKAQPPALAAGETRSVTIETSKGRIVIKVEGALGPFAAGNFVALAECGFFDGLVFHRAVPNFMIQGGDPTGTGRGGPGYQFQNDPVTVPYEAGVVAMANAGQDTNGSQFFIVLVDYPLDPDYSIFGRVIEGLDTAIAIAAAADSEYPTNPVAMTTVSVSNP